MKILGATVILFSTVLLWLVLHQYFFCPRFSFVESESFSGLELYNPYGTMDSSQWVMCNFHAHSNAWRGLTNGKGTPTNISEAYDSLGYGVHLVSDYHKIDMTREYEATFIPAYEHGYNIKKVHYLVLGNPKVNWLDYPLPQLLSNKQRILNQLAQSRESVILLNHPDMRNGFESDDLKYLSGYHYIEALSPYSRTTYKWDAALSAGKPIFVAGNDDTHNVFDKRGIGNFCTWVNTPSVEKNAVLAALKNGNSFAMQIPEIMGESFIEKTNRIKTKLPRLNSFRVKDGTIQLSIDRRAKEIIFTGEHGVELHRVTEAKVAFYAIKETDPYVRATITYHDGTKIFLNPVFKFTNTPFINNQPVIDRAKTNFFGFLGILIILLWGLLVYHLALRRPLKTGIFRLPLGTIRPFQG